MLTEQLGHYVFRLGVFCDVPLAFWIANTQLRNVWYTYAKHKSSANPKVQGRQIVIPYTISKLTVNFSPVAIYYLHLQRDLSTLET